MAQFFRNATLTLIVALLVVENFELNVESLKGSHGKPGVRQCCVCWRIMFSQISQVVLLALSRPPYLARFRVPRRVVSSLVASTSHFRHEHCFGFFFLAYCCCSGFGFGVWLRFRFRIDRLFPLAADCPHGLLAPQRVYYCCGGDTDGEHFQHARRAATTCISAVSSAKVHGCRKCKRTLQFRLI